MSLIRRIRSLFFFTWLTIMPLEKSGADALDKANVYHCRKLAGGEELDWPSLQLALSSHEKVSLKQSWLATPERRFAPASVSAGWSDKYLYVSARLEDRDIFNPLMGLNKPAYEKGDIFEILIRPRSGEAYFEFHITPRNQVLQLRFPQPGSLSEFHESGAKPEALIDTFKIPEPVLESHAKVRQEQNLWTVLVKIPASAISPGAPFRSGNTFLFSFCRYDRTRGEANPVLSSTSNHPVCSFHRQEEWRVMTLEDN